MSGRFAEGIMQPVQPFSDALEESLAVQGAASALGFDWPDVNGVLDKVEEELEEIRTALADGNYEHAQRELGDLLLVSVNLARFLHIHPRQALHDANLRFHTRFESLKNLLARSGKCVEDCSLEELDSVWDQVKAMAAQGFEVVLDSRPIHEANSTLPSGADLRICP